MKQKIVFIMACALMIIGISLIVNSVFDFIGKTKDTEASDSTAAETYLTEQTENY